jgi:hypothetical protein
MENRTTLKKHFQYISTNADKVTKTNVHEIMVAGNGINSSNNPTLAKKAKRKTISTKLVFALIDLAKENGDDDILKTLWQTYHCLSIFISNGKKLHGNYCRTRYCTSCNAIRKAEKINKYLPVMETWGNDLHFVTLTVKAVKARSLNLYMDGMQRAFALILDRLHTRHRRKNGIKAIGIRTLECNYNPIKKTYNPHFHLIVPSKEVADLLKAEWMKQWRSDKKIFVYHGAQYIRKVGELESDLVETIKYGSKVFTSHDHVLNSYVRQPPVIYAKAFYNILKAMKGHKLFNRFGFNLPTQIKPKAKYQILSDYKQWHFDIAKADWIEGKTGEALSGFAPSPELDCLLNNSINTSQG